MPLSIFVLMTCGAMLLISYLQALFYDRKLGIEYPNKEESLPPGIVRAYRQAWMNPV
jgi:hypothetical protein